MEGSRLFRTQCRFCVSCPHRPRTGTLNLATSHIACVLRIHLAPHRLAIHLIVECQRAFDPDECACHRHAQPGQHLHREMRLHQWWMRWPRREVRYPDIPAISRQATRGETPRHVSLKGPMSHVPSVPLHQSPETCTPSLNCLYPIAET